MEEEGDSQHRREEQERRAKRKASKVSKSEAQLEKERKQKEHRQKVLQQHATDATGSGIHSSATKSKSSSTASDLTKSLFQELFSQRAQGFQVDFRFRNAPPRPPVGPTFVGHSLESLLIDQCQQYKPLNAVEVQYKWKLHNEVDLGVPLAPSAMDLRSYSVKQHRGNSSRATTTTTTTSEDGDLHPDDAELLNWTGSLGDTAADQLKYENERKRIRDRMILNGKRPPPSLMATSVLPIKSTAASTTATATTGTTTTASTRSPNRPSKKGFSRVLNESMQTWMKKTTYLSNDYTRKVHDFKSLAQTKQELAVDLQQKQGEMSKRQSAVSISREFAPLDPSRLTHPSRSGLKPKTIFDIVPDIEHWGIPVTHVVLDKPPIVGMDRIEQSFVGSVERNPSTSRLSCQLFVPTANAVAEENRDSSNSKSTSYAGGDSESLTSRFDSVLTYELDVIPLKKEDAPHSHFVVIMDRDTKTVTYLPISSRVQLSRGRPVQAPADQCFISRRSLTTEEVHERDERLAEINSTDLAHSKRQRLMRLSSTAQTTSLQGIRSSREADKETTGDGSDHFGDDDDSDSSKSGDGAHLDVSTTTTTTIAMES